MVRGDYRLRRNISKRNTDPSLQNLLRLPLAPFQLTHDSSTLPKAQDKSLEGFLDSFIFPIHTFSNSSENSACFPFKFPLSMPTAPTWIPPWVSHSGGCPPGLLLRPLQPFLSTAEGMTTLRRLPAHGSFPFQVPWWLCPHSG